MPVHTLKPSYAQVFYHSSFGAHVMTQPTRQWTPTIIENPQGSYVAWDDSARDADEMINDLVDVLLPKFKSSVSFDQYTLWNFDEDAGFFIPVAANALTGKVGTDGTSAWDEAVESIMTVFDTAFNTAKLVLLDMNSRNNFARRTGATVDADEQAMFDVWSGVTYAWASRAGFRPATIRSVSLGINDELKKQYSGI